MSNRQLVTVGPVGVKNLPLQVSSTTVQRRKVSSNTTQIHARRKCVSVGTHSPLYENQNDGKTCLGSFRHTIWKKLHNNGRIVLKKRLHNKCNRGLPQPPVFAMWVVKPHYVMPHFCLPFRMEGQEDLVGELLVLVGGLLVLFRAIF